MRFNNLSIFAADTHAAVTHLNQHRTTVLNHSDRSARNKAEVVQTVYMARITMDFRDDTFFTGFPTAEAACTHCGFLITT